MFCPSISVVNCGYALSRASQARQSYPCCQYVDQVAARSRPGRRTPSRRDRAVCGRLVSGELVGPAGAGQPVGAGRPGRPGGSSMRNGRIGVGSRAPSVGGWRQTLGGRLGQFLFLDGWQTLSHAGDLGAAAAAALPAADPAATGPGAELAERLGVSARTVRSDVERLRDLGYPVHATRGVGRRLPARRGRGAAAAAAGRRGGRRGRGRAAHGRRAASWPGSRRPRCGRWPSWSRCCRPGCAAGSTPLQAYTVPVPADGRRPDGGRRRC